MKRLLYILSAIILFTSCRKGYVCTCQQTVDPNGGLFIATYDLPKQQAVERCDMNEGNPDYTSCQLN